MLAVLTAALVLITGYYAWQTRGTLKEMREVRRLAALPRLVLDLHMATPIYAMLVVQNVGPGPALNGDLEIVFEGASAGTDSMRRWRPHLISSGEKHQFLPPEGVGSLDALAAAFPRVILRGHVHDGFGERHTVDERIDVAAAAAVLEEALHLFVQDPVERVVKELEKSHRQLERLVKATQALSPTPPSETSD